jgi:hypothetical protein
MVIAMNLIQRMVNVPILGSICSTQRRIALFLLGEPVGDILGACVIPIECVTS